MNFQFKLNLQRMAKQSYAVSLWEREDSRRKMKEYFYKHSRVKAEDDWKKITKSVIQHLNASALPLILYNEMIYVIRDIGLKIFDWFNSLKCMNLFSDVDRKTLYDLYFQEIRWTYYGAIDGLKILRSWMEAPGVDSTVIYYMTCLNCLVDEIPTIWQKLSSECRKQIKAKKSKFLKKYGYYIVAYWLARNDGNPTALQKFNRAIFRKDGDLEEYLDIEQSPEANMMIFSAKKGYRKAVEYFWEHITPEEQRDNLVVALNWALRIIGKRNWFEQYYRKEQLIETCVFLMEKLDENNMKKVINYKCMETPLFGGLPGTVTENTHNLIDLFIEVWPWQEFFTTAFNLIKSHLNEREYCHAINLITFCMYKDHEAGYPINNSVHQRMFHTVWREMPDRMKTKKVVESSTTLLFNIWDIPSIRMILHDPSATEIRVEFTKLMFHHLIKLLKHSPTEKVDQIIDEIFCDVDTKTKIPENEIYKFILKNDFDSLKNLEKPCSSGLKIFEEFQKIKSGIDAEPVCHYFISRNEFCLADKFLRWRFGKKNEINSFKSKFQEKVFTREKIYCNWIQSDEKTAQELSEKFIKWFVKTPKQLESFKKEKVVIVDDDYDFDHEKTIKFYMAFVEEDRYEMVLPLLKWCGIDEYYIGEVQRILIKDVRVPYYMETNQIDKAENYLKWGFDTEEKRIKLLRDLIHSKIGLTSCKNFIANCCDDKTENLTESFKKFINFWFKPTGSVKRLKRKLISWKENLEKIDKDVVEKSKAYDLLSDDEDYENSLITFGRTEIYCPQEKLNLFISLLDSFESGDDQSEPDDGGDSSSDSENNYYKSSDEDDEESDGDEDDNDEDWETYDEEDDDDYSNFFQAVQGGLTLAIANRLLNSRFNRQSETTDEESGSDDGELTEEDDGELEEEDDGELDEEDDGELENADEDPNEENEIVGEKNDENAEVVEVFADDNLHNNCKIE